MVRWAVCPVRRIQLDAPGAGGGGFDDAARRRPLLAQEVWSMAAVAAGIAVLSGYLGLLLSYHHNLPSGPAIILTAGMTYLLSIALGHRDGLLVRFLPRKHLQA
jgi:hypothetical protein